MVKKLKPIPSDLLSYIQIEGEAIKDSTDKQMIVSYAHGKMDTINWYIDLLTVGSSRYSVPHSLGQLNSIKQQLQMLIDRIISKPIPSQPPSPTSYSYPKGYEG